MAKLTFDSIENQVVDSTNNGEGGGTSVKFFALKSEESAIVRIMCDSVDDIEIYTVHNVVTDQWKYGKRMSCLRDPHDPMDKCPLCAAQKPLLQRMYVKMIQYVTDPQTNQVIPTPVIWERGVNDRQFGARTLKGYLDTFGPLSNILFKLTRHGEQLNTTYQIIPNLPENVYPQAVYANVPGIFGDYNPAGRAFMDRSAEDYRTFLATGSFPNPNAQATPKMPETAPAMNAAPNFPQQTYAAPQAPAYTNPAPQMQTFVPSAPTMSAPQQTAPAYSQTPRQTMPWENPNTTSNVPSFERPIRKY